VLRCSPARSFAVASCSVVVLAASVAGCGGRGADDADRLTGVVTTVDPPGTTAPATTVAVSAPPVTTVAPVDAELDTALSSIDAELRELDAALKDFDQITATTEGDPSQ
jgi:hypothetical protein